MQDDGLVSHPLSGSEVDGEGTSVMAVSAVPTGAESPSPDARLASLSVDSGARAEALDATGLCSASCDVVPAWSGSHAKPPRPVLAVLPSPTGVNDSPAAPATPALSPDGSAFADGVALGRPSAYVAGAGLADISRRMTAQLSDAVSQAAGCRAITAEAVASEMSLLSVVDEGGAAAAAAALVAAMRAHASDASLLAKAFSALAALLSPKHYASFFPASKLAVSSLPSPHAFGASSAPSAAARGSAVGAGAVEAACAALTTFSTNAPLRRAACLALGLLLLSGGEAAETKVAGSGGKGGAARSAPGSSPPPAASLLSPAQRRLQACGGARSLIASICASCASVAPSSPASFSRSSSLLVSATMLDRSLSGNSAVGFTGAVVSSSTGDAPSAAAGCFALVCAGAPFFFDASDPPCPSSAGNPSSPIPAFTTSFTTSSSSPESAAVAALLSHGCSSPAVAQHGCAALVALCATPGGQARAGAAGAVPAVVSSMEAFAEHNADVALAGCWALANLGTHASNEASVGSLGGVEAALAAMAAHPAGEAIQRFGSWAVLNACWKEEHTRARARAACGGGGPGVLRAAAERFADTDAGSKAAAALEKVGRPPVVGGAAAALLKAVRAR